MIFKFFLVYLGSLLACSIAMFALAKKFTSGLTGTGKKPIVYGTFSSVIASLSAYASTFISDNLYTVFWFLLGIFLIFGILHVLLIQKKFFDNDVKDNSKVFFGELLFAVSVVLFTVVVFSSLQYFLKDKGKDFLFYPMMLSTLGFFLPVLVTHTFKAAYDIPPPVYNTWVYPDAPVNLPEEDPREKLLVIGFEISKKITDTKRTFFRAKAPEAIYLGDLYYFFINDYNELQSETPIQFCKAEETCEWIFRLKTKWYQRPHVLDPLLTVKDNGIKENSVIICERIN